MDKRIKSANIGEFHLRNKTIREIIGLSEGKGYEAERDKDYRMAHFYFQHADHWKRSQNHD